MVILGLVASKSPAKARFQAVEGANQAKITMARSIIRNSCPLTTLISTLLTRPVRIVGTATAGVLFEPMGNHHPTGAVLDGWLTRAGAAVSIRMRNA
jgi:hypothetical protein